MNGAPRVRRFFKVFFPDHHSHRLEIPPGFRKHAQDLILGTVSLVGSTSGNTWEVELAEVEGKLFFQYSWADFVRDNNLQAGEFLVFEYEGQCRFTVMVLDHSCCEKQFSVDVCPPPLHQTSEVLEGFKEGAVEVNGRESLVDLAKTVGREESGKKKRGKKKILLSHRRPVQREEITRAEKRALAFRSRNPSVTVVLKKSSVYTGYMLNLPQTFAKAHLPEEGGSLKLIDPDERESFVTFVSTYGSFFSAGWRKFSLINHLEEHDACVFEVIEPGTMRVHIFRVVEELVPKSSKYL